MTLNFIKDNEDKVCKFGFFLCGLCIGIAFTCTLMFWYIPDTSYEESYCLITKIEKIHHFTGSKVSDYTIIACLNDDICKQFRAHSSQPLEVGDYVACYYLEDDPSESLILEAPDVGGAFAVMLLIICLAALVFLCYYGTFHCDE